MARTNAFTLPLLMDQPISWRIREIGTDDPQGFARDKPCLPEQSCAACSRQSSCRRGGRDPCAPKNFVRHPVPDSNETALQEQDRLDRRPRMTIEESVHKRAIELVRGEVGPSLAPPGRLGPALMKSHASEQTRIAQNKGLPRLLQDKVIVFLWTEPCWLRAQFTAHAEVDPNPVSPGKREQHLLAPSTGTQETPTS